MNKKINGVSAPWMRLTRSPKAKVLGQITIHAEIEYTNAEGYSVHSDVCPPNCSPTGLQDEEYRKFLHDVLDEWLDKSKGTGGFYISGKEAAE